MMLKRALVEDVLPADATMTIERVYLEQGAGALSGLLEDCPAFGLEGTSSPRILHTHLDAHELPGVSRNTVLLRSSVVSAAALFSVVSAAALSFTKQYGHLFAERVRGQDLLGTTYYQLEPGLFTY